MSPSQRLHNLDIQDTLVSFVSQLIGRVAAVRVPREALQTHMHHAAKPYKRGDALYYVMIQTQCIYILCYLWGSLALEYKA